MTQSNSQLSAYDVEQEIGRGDLTIIYRARRKSDGLPVTVKVLAPQFVDDPYLVRRFVEAGQRAARLDHPNIASVYEAGQREDVVYIIREWIEDESLADRLARTGTMSLKQAVVIVHQIAAALDYAHSKRLMHGDLKARCVFVAKDGHVTLADLGLAQVQAGTDPWTGIRITKTAKSTGTPEYLSSERAQGQGPNRAADIFALGVLTYEMLAGQVPFSGTPAEILDAQIHKAPPALHTINPDVPVAVSEVVSRALAKRPEMRFNTATEFARALAAAAEGVVPVRASVGAKQPQSLKVWQRPIFWAIIVGPLIGLLLAIMLWGVAGWGERQAARLADVLTSAPAATPAARSASDLPTANSAPAPVVAPTQAETPVSEPSPSPTPITTPAALMIAEESPFTNLELARGISDDHQPVSAGRDFPTSSQAVYLFFDYQGVEPGTRWGHVWFWGDQQLDRSISTWPEEWGTAGRAWVFYTPEGGYQPGPYEVRLLINDQVVASASFVMR
jgi:serine/threonine protein kinase